MHPDEQPSPEQIEIYRAMSGQRRWQLSEQLYWLARKLKEAGLRHQHPEWSEEKIRIHVREIFLRART